MPYDTPKQKAIAFYTKPNSEKTQKIVKASGQIHKTSLFKARGLLRNFLQSSATILQLQLTKKCTKKKKTDYLTI